MPVRRLNHAVLYVQDARRSSDFYCTQLGFEIAADIGSAIFLRAHDTANDHDLGLFSVGERPGTPAGGTGLYHLAWQVNTIDELVEIRERLVAVDALVGQSDHVVSKSLYARDPDGIEFEVMWAVPPSEMTSGRGAGVYPLDLDAERQRWSGVETALVGLPR